MKPTAQQTAALDAKRTGENFVIEALAGTGKTSTLKLIADDTADRGAYIVFNRKASQEAKGKFPKHVRCGTSHSFAFGPVGSKFKARMDKRDRPSGKQAAQILDIEKPFQLPEDRLVSTIQLARLAQDTVARYCYSKDERILPRHVPALPGAEDVSWDLANYILPLAERAWADLSKPYGKLFFQQDVYLKMWSLGNPRIPADWIAVDEAQDTNPCLMGVVLKQDHAQLIAVGDRNQAIYGWRGAVDAMGTFPATQRLALTQSFRFGPAVADEANVFLDMLGAEHRVTGFDAIPSRVEPVEAPRAVLCRTNAGVIAEALRVPADETYAIVGGSAPIESFAKAAESLMNGRPAPWHADLGAFNTWQDVCDYADNETGGSDIRTLVNLCRDYGPEEIRRVAAGAVDERRLRPNTRVLSTAHKAKGGEWDSVRIAADFTPDGERAEQPLSDSEAMLAYVAVTRAQKILDPSGLAWAKGV